MKFTAKNKFIFISIVLLLLTQPVFSQKITHLSSRVLTANLGYVQFNRGFISTGISYYANGEVSYICNTLQVQYNPFYNIKAINYQASYAFLFIRAGLSGTFYSDFRLNNYCYGPFVGFDAVFAKVYFGWNFFHNDNFKNQVNEGQLSIHISYNIFIEEKNR